MCIAIYKPDGSKLPSKKVFSNCFANNNDGAGFMFPYNGKVHIEKGFMSFTAFKKGLKSAIKKYGLTPLTTPMVFHFRIQSQGGVRADLTHPFPVSRSFDDMRKLVCDCDFGVAHNGIIDFASSYSKVIDYSDTMEFTKEVVFPLLYKNNNYYKSKNTMSILEYLLTGNRFAIMSGDGHVELIGNWIKDGNLYFTNTSYLSKKSYFHSTSSLLASSKWSDYDYEDEYGYEVGFITKEMEKEFLTTDVMHCECGEEMIIEYNYSTDTVYAYCFECGLVYKLTLAAESHAFNKGLCVVDDDYGYDSDPYENSFYGRKVYGGNS